jgi:hypothetical protein
LKLHFKSQKNRSIMASKKVANPLLATSGSFSLADSFGVAAALPIISAAEEDSFVGGGGSEQLSTSSHQSAAPVVPPASPFNFFSSHAPPDDPFSSITSSSTTLPTLPNSPFLPQSVDLAPPSPPRPLPTSSPSLPPAPRLFNPPPVATISPLAATAKRPVYAPTPFISNAGSVSSSAPSPTTNLPGLPPLPQPPVLPPSQSIPSSHNVPVGGYHTTMPASPSYPPQSSPFIQSPAPTLPQVTVHWFYKVKDGVEPIWKPFTVEDSMAIETAMEQGRTDAPIPVDGTRFDVLIDRRVKTSVYWSGDEMEIRRCSWFYKSSVEGRWVPYAEEVASRLEAEYAGAAASGRWQCKVVLENGEWVMLHSPEVMMHFPTSSTSLGALDDWGQVQPNDPALKPRVVHRGLEGLPDIPDGESEEVDHVFFVVHGIGSACDIKFRSITEVVDGFRNMAEDIGGKHFAGARLASRATRVDFLPVNWHKKLHGEDTGTDARLQPLTLRSIPKLRSFVNDTLMDVLFYTSPVYCQTILDTVCREINNTFALYCSRNPGFSGEVSVIGHSLGSLILFDLLSGQVSETEDGDKEAENDEGGEAVEVDQGLVKPRWDKDLSLEEVFEKLGIGDHAGVFVNQGIGMEELEQCSEEDLKEAELPLGPRKKLLNYLKTRTVKTGFQQFQQSAVVSSVDYTVGPAGTGQPSVRYPRLNIKPTAFFALGSPIAVFMAVRGIHTLGHEFKLPSCQRFYNIFHPYDPVSYRIETLVSQEMADLRPLLIPHHMGRKRMHLELKETMTRMGTDIKAKVMDSIRATMGAVYSVAGSFTGQPAESTVREEEERRGVEGHSGEELDNNVVNIDSCLNMGRRIDYVLQEAPMESFNEYLFALASHLCYWDSEDTCLMILREIYSTKNILPDDHLSGGGGGGHLPSTTHLPPGGYLPPTDHLSHSPSMPSFPRPPSGPSTMPRTSTVPDSLSVEQSPAPTMFYNPTPPGSQNHSRDATPTLGHPSFEPPSSSLGPTSSSLGPPSSSLGPPSSSLGPPSSSLGPPSTMLFSPTPSPSGGPPGGVRKHLAYPRPQPVTTFQAQNTMGMDPTAPIASDKPLAPPPMGGFAPK